MQVQLEANLGKLDHAKSLPSISLVKLLKKNQVDNIFCPNIFFRKIKFQF